MADASRLGRAGKCRCGHPREAHEHYRRGTDCAVADCTCVRFERRWFSSSSGPRLQRSASPAVIRFRGLAAVAASSPSVGGLAVLIPM
jgi:hypothetical protein